MSKNLKQGGFGLTMCLNHSVFAIGSGGNTEKVSTTAKNGQGFTEYCINGKTYFKADGDHALTAETLAIGYTALLLVYINAAGTVASKLGRAVLTTTLAAGNDVLEYPALPANMCPLGAVKIANATNIFTVGTTGFDAAGVTDTYIPLTMVPSSPETS